MSASSFEVYHWNNDRFGLLGDDETPCWGIYSFCLFAVDSSSLLYLLPPLCFEASGSRSTRLSQGQEKQRPSSSLSAALLIKLESETGSRTFSSSSLWFFDECRFLLSSYTVFFEWENFSKVFFLALTFDPLRIQTIKGKLGRKRDTQTREKWEEGGVRKDRYNKV